ncbi:Alpha-galactosidase [Mycena chlorophos]|uniref:Alpha-galactosidase n=1 Tax=Mycena chlorophos TaxID=658473 RepID=A0A8H6T2C0_MYCCL|nr:Alpha-galactosidase [Mycena chlorophos]
MSNHDNGPQHAFALLLPELWDCVASFTEDLFALAQVSAALNAAVIAHWANRRGTTLAQFIAGNVPLGADALRALVLYAPLTELPATKLKIHLASSGEPQVARKFAGSMWRLTQLTRRAPRLRDLQIQLRFTIFNWSYPPLAEALHFFCAALSTVAARQAGPVLVLAGSLPSLAFTCWPRDIEHWDLNNKRFNAPSEWYHNIPLPFKRKLHESWYTTTRCHDGSLTRVGNLYAPHNVRLHLEDAPTAQSLLIFDNSRIGPFYAIAKQLYGKNEISPAVQSLLPVFFRNAELPALRTFSIESDVDPVAFRQFLVNHPQLEDLKYFRASHARHRPPVVSPPLLHPGLRKLETSLPYSLDSSAMLRGLHLAPNLEKIVLHFFISSSARGPAASTSSPLDAMLDDLQCLAERPENLPRLTLTLTLYCNPDPSLPLKRSFSARALAWRRQKSIENKAPMFSPSLTIAASLHCIQTVVLNTRSARTAHALLPWLAALPELDELEVFCFARADGGA